MAVSVPHLCRRGSKLCGRFESFCAGWLPLPPDGADTFAVRVSASFAAAGASRWRWDDGASARITSIPCLEVKMAEETSDEKEKNQTKLTKCFAIIKAHGPRKTHTQPMYVQQISFIFRWECCAESTAAAHVSHLLLLCANTSSKWQAAQQMARPRLDRNKSERPATDGHQCIERGHFEYVMKRWLYTLLAKQRSQSRRRNTRDLLWVGFASRRTSRWRATSIPSRALRSIGSDCQSAVSWFGNKSHRAVVPVKIRALVPDRKTPVSNSISYRAVQRWQTYVFEWTFEDLVGQFIGRTGSPVRDVAHVFQTSLEGEDGFVTQLFLRRQFTKQRQFQGIAWMAPQFVVTPATSRRQSLGHRLLLRRPARSIFNRRIYLIFSSTCYFMTFLFLERRRKNVIIIKKLDPNDAVPISSPYHNKRSRHCTVCVYIT